jgi:uncharacterized hydrophobic protein (TIGR00271 family)
MAMGRLPVSRLAPVRFTRLPIRATGRPAKSHREMERMSQPTSPPTLDVGDESRPFALAMHTTPQRRHQVAEDVSEMSTPRGSFYLMVAISTLIAAYGLLANSTAVVIGAMLIAPLMGPIFGIALGLTTGDRPLLVRSLALETLGLLLAVGLAVAVGLMPLRVEFGSEILGRTQPTMYDMIIALAAGLAGTYALIDERLSPTLPGIAISVSLLPPLAACGLCLSAGQWRYAGGAFLLFAANFLAIQIVAALLFTIAGMAEVRSYRDITAPQFARRFGLSLVLFVGMGVFMTHTLVGIVAQRRFSRAVQTTLARELRRTVGAQLSGVDVTRKDGISEVVAVVLTPQAFEPAQVARLEDILQQRVDHHLHLVLRSLISKDADRSGPVFIAAAPPDQAKAAAEQTRLLARVSDVVNEQVNQIPGARLIDIRRETGAAGTVVTAVVRTPAVITPDQAAAMQAALRKGAEPNARLVVRSVPTRSVDALGYLYEASEQPAVLTGQALLFHQRVERALRNQLRQRLPGASLEEFRYARTGAELHLLAIVRTPRPFTPKETAEMQADFRRYVDPATVLVVSYTVAGEVAAVGDLAAFDETSFTGGASRAAAEHKAGPRRGSSPPAPASEAAER